MSASIRELRARLEAASQRTPVRAITAARDRIAHETLPSLEHLSYSTANPVLHEAITALTVTGLELDRARRHSLEALRVTREYLCERLASTTPVDDSPASDVAEPRPERRKLRAPADTVPIVKALQVSAAWVTEDRSTWPGLVDQSQVSRQYRFSRDEYAIAARLAQLYPHRVSPIARTTDRTADSLIDDQVVEFKTLNPIRDHPPTASSIGRTIRGMQRKGHRARIQPPDSADSTPEHAPIGQGDNVIIDGRAALLSRKDAIAGLYDYIKDSPDLAARLTRVRIWGPDYEIDWNRSRG